MSKRDRVLLRRGLPGLLVATAIAGAALAGVAVHAGASTKAQSVRVTEVEYKLTPATRTLKPGSVTFVAVNRGKVSHSLAISGPGLKLKRIPGVIRPGKSG